MILIRASTMLSSTSLTVLTIVTNSLERSTNCTVELFTDQCNQIRDVYYPKCGIDPINGTTVIVYSNHKKTEGRLDEFVEKLWIYYLSKTTGCSPIHKAIGFSERRAFDLLLEPSPYPSRVLLPLFPYHTVKYSIYVRQPAKRVRLFAFYYIFSPTLWIVMLGSLVLVTLVTLLIRSASSSFSPVQDALQSLYNLFANNGSTDGFYASCSTRIVFIVGSTLVLIFWVSFSTFLIAELAVDPLNRLNGDLQQLVTDRNLKAICVDPNSAVQAHLLSTIPSLINVDPCPPVWPKWTALFKEVCNSEQSTVAFVESSTFPQEFSFFHSLEPQPCNLFSLMDNVFQLPKAIIVRRGFPHKEEIGQFFFKIAERGVAHLVTKHLFETLAPEKPEDEIVAVGYLRISVRRLTITFAVLGAGAGLAGIVLILEWVVHRRRQRLTQQQSK